MSTQTDNSEQIRYWNEEAGPKWVAMQTSLDAQIAPFGEAVLDAAALAPGMGVLDVGCGCGATTLAAAARVAPGGEAVGADISRPMLALAAARAEEEGVSNARFVEADAAVHAFEAGSFDRAISRFGVMFFAEPVLAFSNVAKALKPGGTLTFICWNALPMNPWIAVPLAAAAQHIELPAPPAPDEPGPFSLAQEGRVSDILGAAGFRDIVQRPFERELPIGESADLEQSLEFILDVGPVSRLLKDAPEETRARVRSAVGESIAPFHGANGVVLGFSARLVQAVR